MSATDDFLEGMRGLETAASKLSASGIEPKKVLSSDYLQLNGLHVVAFALLEEFLRKRTQEVLSALGKSDVKFDSFPEALKLQLLQETFFGIGALLKRKDVESKVDTLLVEILSMTTAADDKVRFVPSEYCFGRSQSNISYSQLSALLEAFGVELTGSFSAVQERLHLKHLGSFETIFKRISQNRHSAAHAFNADFKLVEFTNDVKVAIKFFAFSFDTILSHAARAIKVSVTKNTHADFSSDAICFHSIRYDSLNNEFKAAREEVSAIHPLPPIRTKNLAASLKAYSTSKHDKDDTLFVIDYDGTLKSWLQPL